MTTPRYLFLLCFFTALAVLFFLTPQAPEVFLYNSNFADSVRLINRDGVVLKDWKILPRAKEDKEGVHYATLDAFGNLYVIIKERRLEKYDPNQNLIWRLDLPIHHDLEFDQEGNLHALSLEAKSIQLYGQKQQFLFDDLLVISPAGVVIKRNRLASIIAPELEKLIPAAELESFAIEENNDLFHLNSLQYLTRRINGFCEPGDYLLTSRALSQIFVIDLKGTKIRWSYGVGQLDMPHRARLISPSRILLFDNGARRGWSRALEIEVPSADIKWQYPSSPDRKFYSEKRGGALRLKNGHTLITIADQGRVIEVDPDSNIRWTFLNPEFDPIYRNRPIYLMQAVIP